MIVATLKQLRRLIIAIIGFTVLAIGAAMIILPGPAFVVIPAGLAILSIEFVWARKLLVRMKAKMKSTLGGKNAGKETDNKQP